jgi:NADP-dependent 3-hydroxy acid dehydrogenase YdfG
MTKTILISGGTKGIGKGAVIQCLNEGNNVITFSRDEKNCKRLREELSAKYSKEKFLVFNANVTKEEDVKDVVEKTIAQYRQIDVLINNAGIGYFRDADQVDITKFRSMIETNIVGLSILTKYVVPEMKNQKRGLIINIASVSGRTAFANGEFYSATKFAVMGYSEGIRNELSPFGIKVATICPGMIETDFFDKEELERRMKLWNGKIPTMLDVADITRIVSLIINQSEHCDIRDIFLMPFE